QVWQYSSERTLLQLFNNDKALQRVPPRHSDWSDKLIRNRIHFFNCHGASDSSKFYGQPIKMKKPSYPPALRARLMDGKIREGTVAGAEFCYGGQLFPLSAKQRNLGVCNVYLRNGCYGFFASTTIAYGPAIGNGQADLICRYFIESVLEGASIGRAALEARQRFVQTAGTLSPADLKTLAQFNLYGDPLITPVKSGAETSWRKADRTALDRAQRQQRRGRLFRQGQLLHESVPRTHSSAAKVSPSVLRALRRGDQITIRPRDVMS